MTATVNNVTRTEDTTGDEIAAFEKDDLSRVQAFAPDPEVCGESLDRKASDGTAVTNLPIKASAGRLFQADVVVLDTVTDPRWLMVLDQTAAPSGGETPIWRARLGGGFASIDFGLYGILCATGIVLTLSSTPGTVTLPGSGEGYFQAGYL